MEFWKIFDFFENFRQLDPPWNTGQKNFFKKINPKHVQNTFEHFWYDCGQFWNFKSFLIFLKIFEDSTLHRTLGKETFEKITPKHVQNTFGHFWERFWVCLEFWKIFDFFENFRRLDPPWNTGQKIFRKNYPKTCLKHVWKVLGTILGFSAILKSFWFFWKFSTTRPSKEHWAKKLFRKNRLKTCSTHVWTLLGTISGIFCNFWKFSIFLKIFEDSTLHGRLGKKKFSKKLTQNIFKTRLDTFGNDCGHSWTFESFCFFWKFSKTRPTMEHWAEKLSKKLPQNMFKTRLDTYGNDFGFVWNFGKIFDFFENFRRLDPPWNTGQKNFRKNYPKTCSKHVWTLMGTILGLFGILENFWIFWKFSKTRPSMEHWAKKFSKKLPQNMFKTRLEIFGNDFRLFCNFEKFLIFLKIFDNSTLHGRLGKKNFSKKLTQNMFKTRLDTFGNDFGHFFGILKSSLIFLKIFDKSTLQGRLGKKTFFRKKRPKACSKHVWTLLGTISGIFAIFENFWLFWKFSKTRPSMEHWAKNFSKKLPQNMFKTRLEIFGNDFRLFCNFEKFLIFLKIFDNSTL